MMAVLDRQLGGKVPRLYVVIATVVILTTVLVIHRRWATEKNRSESLLEQSKCHEYSPAYPSAGGGGCSPISARFLLMEGRILVLVQI